VLAKPRNHWKWTPRLNVPKSRFVSPLLRGGWRIDPSRAFCATIDVLEDFRDYPATFTIHSLVPEHHEHLVGLARSFGFRDS